MKEKTSFLYGILYLSTLLHIFPLAHTLGTFLAAFSRLTVLFPIVYLLGMMLLLFLLFKDRIINIKLTAPLFVAILLTPIIFNMAFSFIPLPRFIYLEENAVDMHFIPTIIRIFFMTSIAVLAYCRCRLPLLQNNNNNDLISGNSIDEKSFYRGVACYMFVFQIFVFIARMGKIITKMANVNIGVVLFFVAIVVTLVLLIKTISRKNYNIAPNALAMAITVLMIFFNGYTNDIYVEMDYAYLAALQAFPGLCTYVLVIIAFVYYRRSLKAEKSLSSENFL